jgi:ATP-GRASP peptide maturase of grasp-with-spasm system
VLDWLDYYNSKWIRINPTDFIDISINFSQNNTEVLLYLKTQTINLDEINSFWYRRGEFNFERASLSKSFPFYREIISNINEEIATTQEIIHYKLLEKKGISSRLNASVNKGIILMYAQKNGLNIPETVITNRLDGVKKIRTNQEVISKAISEAIFFYDEKLGAIQAYTNTVEGEIKTLPKIPSLFQQQIKKKYELRIFFLNGKSYAMAIFSQQDKQTEVDFRKYNREKPNRTVPYKLPREIEQKIIHFMDEIKLTSGSIDMIVDVNNRFTFLEVNPVGQFGMVSYPCNYNLEKQIASYLK